MEDSPDQHASGLAGAKNGRHAHETKNIPFRLLDLNLDCRHMIYAIMLKIDGSHTCSAQILATCKQINEEATPYLYGINNIFEVKLVLREMGEGHWELMVRVHNGIFFLDDRGDISLPDYLKKCEHLRFGIGSHNDHQIRGAGFTLKICHSPPSNRYLQGAEDYFDWLCYFLGRQHCLKSLTVDLRTPHSEGSQSADGFYSGPVVVDLYSIRYLQHRKFEYSVMGTTDPYQWRSSPMDLPEIVELTPKLAASCFRRALKLLFRRIDSYEDLQVLLAWRQTGDDYDTLMDYTQESLMEMRYNHHGPFTYRINPRFITELRDYATSMNTWYGPVNSPDREFRPFVYAILHATTELEIACRSAGLDLITVFSEHCDHVEDAVDDSADNDFADLHGMIEWLEEVD